MIIKKIPRDPLQKKEVRLPASVWAALSDYREYYAATNQDAVEDGELLGQFVEHVTASDKGFQRFLKGREKQTAKPEGGLAIQQPESSPQGDSIQH